MLNGEEGLECKVSVDGCSCSMCQNLNNWDMFWMNHVQMRQSCRKVGSGRRVAGAISSLVNAKDLQLECASLARNIGCSISYVWQ